VKIFQSNQSDEDGDLLPGAEQLVLAAWREGKEGGSSWARSKMQDFSKLKEAWHYSFPFFFIWNNFHNS
jgi:hypothetical protein